MKHRWLAGIVGVCLVLGTLVVQPADGWGNDSKWVLIKMVVEEDGDPDDPGLTGPDVVEWQEESLSETATELLSLSGQLLVIGARVFKVISP